MAGFSLPSLALKVTVYVIVEEGVGVAVGVGVVLVPLGVSGSVELPLSLPLLQEKSAMVNAKQKTRIAIFEILFINASIADFPFFK